MKTRHFAALLLLSSVLPGCPPSSSSRESELEKELAASRQEIATLKSRETEGGLEKPVRPTAATDGGPAGGAGTAPIPAAPPPVPARELFEEVVFATDGAVVQVPTLRELRTRGNSDKLTPEQNVLAASLRGDLLDSVESTNPALFKEFAADVTSGDAVRVDAALMKASEAVFEAHLQLAEADAAKRKATKDVFLAVPAKVEERAKVKSLLRDKSKKLSADSTLLVDLAVTKTKALAVMKNVFEARSFYRAVGPNDALARNRIRPNVTVDANDARGFAITIVAVAVVVVAVAALVINYIDIGKPGDPTSKLLRDQLSGEIANAYKGVAFQ